MYCHGVNRQRDGAVWWRIGYCIPAETLGTRCTTHGPQNLFMLVFESKCAISCHTRMALCDTNCDSD
jgi:hypothetical protein